MLINLQQRIEYLEQSPDISRGVLKAMLLQLPLACIIALLLLQPQQIYVGLQLYLSHPYLPIAVSTGSVALICFSDVSKPWTSLKRSDLWGSGTAFIAFPHSSAMWPIESS